MQCFIVLAALLVCAVTGCKGPSLKDQATRSENAKRRVDEEKESFVYMAQNFVKKHLPSTSASTAKFPPPSEASLTKLGDNKYRVAAYFDMQNKSGVPVRSNYVCEVTRISSGKWRCDNLKMQPSAPLK